MSDTFMTHIYRSDRKEGLYLYLAENKSIDELDEALLKLIGQHTHVMELDLNSRSKLANEDIETVKQNLKEKGYHLQVPPDIIKNVIKYT